MSLYAAHVCFRPKADIDCRHSKPAHFPTYADAIIPPGCNSLDWFLA
jgi:hypothetical protein